MLHLFRFSSSKLVVLPWLTQTEQTLFLKSKTENPSGKFLTRINETKWNPLLECTTNSLEFTPNILT